MLVLCCLLAPAGGRHALVAVAHDPAGQGAMWDVWQAHELDEGAPPAALLTAAETAVRALEGAGYSPMVAMTGMRSRSVLRSLRHLVGDRTVFSVEVPPGRDQSDDGPRLTIGRDLLLEHLAAVLESRDLATLREVPGVAEVALALGDHLAGRGLSTLAEAAAVAVWLGETTLDVMAERAVLV